MSGVPYHSLHGTLSFPWFCLSKTPGTLSSYNFRKGRGLSPDPDTLSTPPAANLFFSLLCRLNTWRRLGSQYIGSGFIAFFKKNFLFSHMSCQLPPPLSHPSTISNISHSKSKFLMTPSFCICYSTSPLGPLEELLLILQNPI